MTAVVVSVWPARGAAGGSVGVRSAAFPTSLPLEVGSSVGGARGPTVKLSEEKITCMNSAELGLGSCPCLDHKPWFERDISSAYFFDRVRKGVKKVRMGYLNTFDNIVRFRFVLSTVVNDYGEEIEDEVLKVTLKAPSEGERGDEMVVAKFAKGDEMGNEISFDDFMSMLDWSEEVSYQLAGESVIIRVVTEKIRDALLVILQRARPSR